MRCYKRTRLIRLLFLLHCARLMYSLPIDTVQTYLKKYGYLDESNGNVRDAIIRLQNHVHLPETGEIDAATNAIMLRPRCGNEDHLDIRRRRRFIATDHKWQRTVLTWRLDDPYGVLRQSDIYVVRNTLHRAFNDWSMAVNKYLRFVEIQNRTTATSDQRQPDITVYFAYGDHNDSLPFDGQGGIVAHGFYPTNGNLHFDAAEKWTLNMPDGINLYQTAVHEIGHLLGLQHSADSDAVMFPVNRPYSSTCHRLEGIQF